MIKKNGPSLQFCLIPFKKNGRLIKKIGPAAHIFFLISNTPKKINKKKIGPHNNFFWIPSKKEVWQMLTLAYEGGGRIWQMLTSLTKTL